MLTFRNGLYLVFLSLLTAVALLPYAATVPSVLIEDDGYFYAQLAEKIAATGKSTFDGINITSGYHLLWGAVLAVTAKLVLLVSSSKLAMLCAFLFVNLLITYAYVFSSFQRPDARLLAIVLAAISSFLTETALLVLLLLVFYRWFLRYEEQEDRRAPGWPVLCSLFLIPLARIDSALMLIAPLGYYLFKDRRLFLRLSAPVVLGVIVHFSLMLWLFGKPYSVSSYLKASSATLQLCSNLWGLEIGHTIRCGLAFALIAVAAHLCWKRRSVPVAVVVLSVLAFYGPHLLFNVLRHWYFLPVYIPLAYLVFRYCEELPLQKLFTPAVYGLGALLLLGYGLHYQVIHETDRINSHLFVAEVNRMTRESDVIYQIDGSGYTGYFLKAHVVNGDGLVNSYEYADRSRRNGLAGYLDEIGATYIIDNHHVEGDMLVDNHGLKVPRSQVERVLDVPLCPNNRYCCFALYRLKR